MSDDKPIIEWKRMPGRRWLVTITRTEEIEEQKRDAEWARMTANALPSMAIGWGYCPCCGRSYAPHQPYGGQPLFGLAGLDL